MGKVVYHFVREITKNTQIMMKEIAFLYFEANTLYSAFIVLVFQPKTELL